MKTQTNHIMKNKSIIKLIQSDLTVILQILAMIVMATLFSCDRETLPVNANRPVSKEMQAYKDFAVILSKAVSSEPQLRVFLQEEALKQYDKDYDVFYPWTKECSVDGKRSFKEVLAEYDTDGKMGEIESTIPLLTILVPDWSWIGLNAFSVTSWNAIEENALVGYEDENGVNVLYKNGKHADDVPSYVIPGYPVVMIKSNERMKASPSVKGSPVLFDFLDPEFDGSNELATKGNRYYEHNFNVPPAATNSFSSDAIPLKDITAYNYSVAQPLLKQRDHIYYDMTDVLNTGYANFHYAERLFKCKIHPSELTSGFTDDQVSSANKDWKTTKHFGGKLSGLPDTLTDSQLVSLSWVEGKVELQFDISVGDAAEQRFKTINFNEAFYASRVMELYHYVWVDSFKYREYYVEEDDLVPRWIDLDFLLFTWDLSDIPTKYKVAISEYDMDTNSSYSQNLTFKMSANIAPTSGQKTNWGITAGADYSNTYTFSFTQKSDNLGSFYVYYTDPIVTSVSGSDVTVYQYNTGKVDVLIVPVDIY